MLIKHTFDELAAEAEKRRREVAATAPDPRVINADAVIQFTAPRRFEVGGIGLRAPPLPFPAGVRLLVAANALRDLRKADPPAPLEFLATARDVAVALLSMVLRPSNPIRRIRGKWLRPFRLLETEELEKFLRSLLYVPDSSPDGPPPNKAVTVDLMDQAMAVARAWPTCVDAPRFLHRGTGLPLLWAHYVYGSRHLGRVRAREDLRMASAFRIAQGAEMTDWKGYLAEEREAAGWSDHG